MKVEFDEYHRHQKQWKIERLQRQIKGIDQKIKRLEKIKPGTLHSKTLEVKRRLLLVKLAKERMFGD